MISNTKNNHKRGFLLLELAIAVIVIGITLTYSTMIFLEKSRQSKIIETQDKLKVIESALKTYYNIYNRPPCPTMITLASTNAKAGMSAFWHGAVQAAGANWDCSSCTSDDTGTVQTYVNGTATTGWLNNTAPSGDRTGIRSSKFWVSTISNFGTVVNYGGVPYIDLGLSSYYAYDAWGNKFSYYMDPNSNNDATTMMSVQNMNSNTLDNSIKVMVLSHGPDGIGAYRTDGTQTLANVNSASTEEQQNICQAITTTCSTCSNHSGTANAIRNSTAPLYTSYTGSTGDISIARTAADLSGSSNGIGTIAMTLDDTPPDGWLLLDGGWTSPTNASCKYKKSDYPDLWRWAVSHNLVTNTNSVLNLAKFYSLTITADIDANPFCTPDFRGYFIRGNDNRSGTDGSDLANRFDLNGMVDVYWVNGTQTSQNPDEAIVVSNNLTYTARPLGSLQGGQTGLHIHRARTWDDVWDRNSRIPDGSHRHLIAGVYAGGDWGASSSNYGGWQFVSSSTEPGRPNPRSSGDPNDFNGDRLNSSDRRNRQINPHVFWQSCASGVGSDSDSLAAVTSSCTAVTYDPTLHAHDFYVNAAATIGSMSGGYSQSAYYDYTPSDYFNTTNTAMERNQRMESRPPNISVNFMMKVK